LPDLDWHVAYASESLDFPQVPNGVMSLHAMTMAAHAGCRVSTTGVGGDQWLKGSSVYYAEELRAGDLRALMSCLGEDLRDRGIGGAVWALVRGGILVQLPEALKERLRRWANRRPELLGSASPWVAPHLRELTAARRPLARRWTQKPFARLGQRAMWETLLQPYDAFAAEQMERTYAREQLEARHPFRTARMAQFAFSSPTRIRARGKVDKWVHRRALGGLVPDKILKRSSKGDFTFTIHRQLVRMASWFSHESSPAMSDWLLRDELIRCFERYCSDPEAEAWRGWVLWNALAVAAVVRAPHFGGVPR
jgi:asparagine synthase (glutamine-hydrolysing)